MENFLSTFVLLMLAATAVSASKENATSNNKYCNICSDHTLCMYKGLGETCKGSSDGGVTVGEQKIIVDSHNFQRRLVAKGGEERGNGQPSASNMQKMKWDKELAKTAQKWADQCDFKHDTCRNDPRFTVGQNIYWNWRFPVTKDIDWLAAIKSWYDEVDKFDPKIVPLYEFNAKTGHYTQLVWHNTNLVGCGRRSYGPNKIYVCNYGPAGNYLNEPIYDIGPSCSRCLGSCDDGLCTEAGTNETTEDGLAVTDSIRILDPPAIDAIDYYHNTEASDNESDDTTEWPVHLNIIDGLEIPDDAEIRDEIEDLKKRIRNLVEKIASKKLQQVQ